MKPRLSVYFDYVCPFCLLAEDVIADVARDHGLEVEWKPFELRPHPRPTLRPEDDYLPSIWARAVYPMARRLNVPIKLPTVSPQPYSHTAFEGLVHAAGHELGRRYNQRVLRAFFQEDLDIGDVEVLTRLAGEIGLDSGEFRAALVDQRHQGAHQAALAEAYEVGIEAVPTMVMGSHRFSGVPTRAQLSGLAIAALDEARASTDSTTAAGTGETD